ncbi:hypothetical protein SAY87_018854 [Trapa incisa]|uniref:Oligopeptide transporter 4 n=1 Tax=Trapa incisa TaxID=236973 RepID=A0AAN7K4U0_9MYRT|nr:hypothetical protein SAY87_018854 [Trapa incisa]
MGPVTVGVEAPPQSSMISSDPEKAGGSISDEDASPIEQVRLTVLNTDDPTLPVWTFRMWFLGLISCCLLSFLNQFFAYRTEPLVITQITIQVATLPIGRFLAAFLPTATFRLPGLGEREFSVNPGPFNMKEHVLISIFANAGSAFGSGSAYAVSIVNIIKAFYGRSISFFVGWLLIITTQFEINTKGRALHEKDARKFSRAKFFLIALICSFIWYAVPGYLFSTLTNISWICWVFSKSVTAQQLGSGMHGLGLGALTLDWAAVASFLFSPLICPFFAIMNVFAGYALFIYVVMPMAYWGFNVYSAHKFPIFSSHLFTSQGQVYNITKIVNDKFELDIPAYEQQGRIHLSMFFALSYGFGFATIASTLTHVGLFYGSEIYQRYKASNEQKEDIHTRLMKRYEDIPLWWFHLLLVVTLVVSLALCIFMREQIQMPWWALVFASILAFFFTLPISIITATTNQTPGLNIITEYLMGLIHPGRPIANVCFKTYGYMSMAQAVSFLNDFKLGQYWIPLINLPILLGATGAMPPATPLNYNAWVLVGTVFNFFIFRYHKRWWQRYNYILSAALDAGVAFMGVLLYLAFEMENKTPNWWGTAGEHCDLATCPTAKEVKHDYEDLSTMGKCRYQSHHQCCNFTIIRRRKRRDEAGEAEAFVKEASKKGGEDAGKGGVV